MCRSLAKCPALNKWKLLVICSITAQFILASPHPSALQFKVYFCWAKFCPSALVVTKSRFRQIRGEIFGNDLRRQVPLNLKSWVHFVVKPQFCFCISFFFFFNLLQGASQPVGADCSSCCESAQFLAVMSYFLLMVIAAPFVAPLAVEGEWLVSAPVVAEPCNLMCMVFHWKWSAKI